jgi:hypothetical protein
MRRNGSEDEEEGMNKNVQKMRCIPQTKNMAGVEMTSTSWWMKNKGYPKTSMV